MRGRDDGSDDGDGVSGCVGGAGWGGVGWAVVERVEGRAAESVDKRVVGRDGGGGVNGGECVRCVEGGVAVAAAALRWWRWRRRRERRVGRPALAATATTMAVMEAAKEVAVKEVVRLRGSMRTRATRGEKKWASNCSTAEKGRRSHPLGAS